MHSLAWESLSDKVALKQESQGNKDGACGILGEERSGKMLSVLGPVGWRGLNEWESGSGRSGGVEWGWGRPL